MNVPKVAFGAIVLVVVVGLFTIFVTSAEKNARERDCFTAGGTITNGVCMPVDGAIKFKGGRE